MKISISGSAVPVALAPEKQTTTSSWVPPFGMPPAAWIWAMLACSVPVNGAATEFVAAEMLLVVVPSLCTSRNTADPWNPVAHAVVVAQVGVLLVAPVVGFRLTAPG